MFAIVSPIRKYPNKQECIYNKIIVMLNQDMSLRKKEAKRVVFNTGHIITDKGNSQGLIGRWKPYQLC